MNLFNVKITGQVHELDDQFVFRLTPTVIATGQGTYAPSWLSTKLFLSIQREKLSMAIGGADEVNSTELLSGLILYHDLSLIQYMDLLSL